MFTEAINMLIMIESIKILIIGVGVSCGFLIIIFGLIFLFKEGDFRTVLARRINTGLMIFSLIAISASITCYNLPILKPEIVIAAKVAPLLDDYVNKHPESIYNPEVILSSTDLAVKGIVDLTKNLPELLKRISRNEKNPEEMTKEELLKFFNENKITF